LLQEVALFSVTALRPVLSLEDGGIMTSAIRKLGRSPFFSILIASGWHYCRDLFATTAQLFKEVDPFNESTETHGTKSTSVPVYSPHKNQSPNF
jgi:hypothetical protein